MRSFIACIAALSIGCSLRGTDHLQSGAVGSGASGGSASAGGSSGGGGSCAVDCDGDGVCDDLEVSTSHCGCCNQPCATSCIQGSCVLSEAGAPNNALLAGVALSARDVYFSDASGTSVWSVAKTGGQTVEAATTLEGTYAVAVKSEVLHYAIAGTSPSMSVGVILQAPDTILASSQAYPQWLDASPAVLAWGNAGAAPSIETRIEVLDPDRYSLPIGAKPTGIAIAGTHVYWTEDGGRVMRAMFALPMAEQLASGQDGAQGIDVGSDGYVYWAARDGVYRMPSGGGAVEPLTDAAGLSPWMVAVDDSHVYWTTLGVLDGSGRSGALRRVPREGGAVETLYTPSQAGPLGGVALDGEHVYFVEVRAPRLLRRAKSCSGG